MAKASRKAKPSSKKKVTKKVARPAKISAVKTERLARLAKLEPMPVPAKMPAAATSMAMSTTMSQLTNMFIAFLVGNSVVIYLANMFFPSQVALGTHLISPMMGLLYSSIVLTVLLVSSVPVIEWLGRQLRMTLSSSHWMLLYLVMNTLFVWFVARFSELLGMGIASWVVAVILAIVLDVIQGMLAMFVVYKK